jgi:hypothetical protein
VEEQVRLTSWLLAVVAFALLSAHPSPAQAAFIFNGFSGEGGIVWDGGFDVSTSNSNCGGTGSLCSSLQLTALTDPDTLQVVVSGGSPTLTFSQVFMVFGFPLNSVNCSDFTYCGTLTSGGLNTLSSVFTGFAALDNLDQPGGASGAPEGNSQIVAVLTSPLDATHFVLPADFWDAFTTLSFDGVRVGVVANFTGADGTPFTLDVVDPNAVTAPVPEPASLLLLGSGLAGVVARRCRRRNSSSQA